MMTGKSERRFSTQGTYRTQPSLVTAGELEDLERASRVLGLSRDVFQRMIDDVQHDAEQAGRQPRWAVEQIKDRMKREFCTR